MPTEYVDAKYREYVLSLYRVVKEQAFAAKAKVKAQGEGPMREELKGILFGYGAAISWLQSYAETFDIPDEETGLAGIDPYNGYMGVI